ncbi:aminopeptidase [Pseudomonas mangrovi]|uniref:Aminopeptidase n=1 Tax=Pseudomonas mangrovi TaxID=2161748 RepID=A0A2T5P9Z5_9PSED|nr:aminopeptidase [Pseudomonas mangrovi]PTU74580.1 aminopeptidase [Pseudomonas mangrovi]
MIDLRHLPLVPLLLVLLLNGCSSYYGQLAEGQWQLLSQRRPIARLVADPATPPELRRRLQLSSAARDFASAQLALPQNDSYRSFVDLQRPYVVWNVFATDEFSVAAREHCFPIAGCVAYRGYFDQGRARGAAALLAEQGLDTWVAGVEAYSTLGWFDDPLLSSMLRRDDARLVAVIIHELAHQRFYLPGDTAFNESYASFVEQEGLRQWYTMRNETPPTSDDAHRRAFIEQVLASRTRLEQLYAGDLSPEQMRKEKTAEFERLRRDYRSLRDSHWPGDTRYDAWFSAPLNNARLLPFGLYDQWVPAFARLFEAHDRDWEAFHHAVENLGELPAARRLEALERLGTAKRG